MKILTVVGARPNFMKAAPIIAAINRHNQAVEAGKSEIPESIQHILVHTGQHYDEMMSGSFFNDLNLPKSDVHLGVGSVSHAVQTGEIMRKFEAVIQEAKPDVVIVVGDVNSTLSCSLVTAKIAFDAAGTRPLIAHVEAGLRSFDRAMPEEVNRVVTDHLCDLLFVTEEAGVRNLRNEGVSAERVHFVGNTMIDSLLAYQEKAESSPVLAKLGLREAGANSHSAAAPYALLTMHRPSNVDNREIFVSILAGLAELAATCPVIFPVHPRTQRRIKDFALEPELEKYAVRMVSGAQGADVRNGIVMIDPLGYLDFLCMMKHAAIVVTDSGGVQEETTCLGVPCVTVRENTERPVTVEKGTNIIAGTGTENIREAIRQQKARKGRRGMPENWDGRAATRIIDTLVRVHVAKTAGTAIPVPQPCA